MNVIEIPELSEGSCEGCVYQNLDKNHENCRTGCLKKHVIYVEGLEGEDEEYELP